jgi:hypothetical protein
MLRLCRQNANLPSDARAARTTLPAAGQTMQASQARVEPAAWVPRQAAEHLYKRGGFVDRRQQSPEPVVVRELVYARGSLQAG